MQKSVETPAPVIHRVTTLDLRFRPRTWSFAQERREEIAAHFASKRRERPKIWNGRVLLGRDAHFGESRFTASYFETDFASFLAWRDWGCPDRTVFNGFGMGALRCRDGAFVLGEMSGDTANAGRVYFPSGTPEPNDIRGESIDISGSIEREVEEETGLTSADYRTDPHWDCVVFGNLVAIIRVLHSGLPGEAMRARIEGNLARQDHPELVAIHLVRSSADFTPAMPRFVTAFIERHLSAS